MAATEAKIGFGTLLQRGNGAVPEIFTNVAEINDVSPPEFTVGSHQVTHHESPGAHHEKIPGLIDTGGIPIKGNLILNNQTQDELTGILADLRARRIVNWRIVYPEAVKTMTCAGFLTKFKTVTPLDGPMQFEAELTVRSAPTFI